MFRKLTAIVLTLVAVLAAGWLALRRPDVPYDTLEYTYALPESQFLTVGDDVKIHYTDTGPRDAPVVMLVHGYAASLHTWTGWQEVLDDSYRVVSLDLPGHGLSRVPEARPVSIGYYAETLDTVADQLGLDSFALAGSSMGGEVAWTYAIDHPDRLDSLILVDAAGWPASAEDRKDSPLVFRLLSIPAARALMRDLDLSSLIESGLKDSFADPSLVTPEMAERYAALSRAPGHRDALLALAARSDRKPATRERLSAIRVPTLILWGEKDNLVPLAHAAQFEAAIEGAVAIRYENVGHIPQEEATRESAADVRAFLDRTVSAVSPEHLVDDQAISHDATAAVATGGGTRPR